MYQDKLRFFNLMRDKKDNYLFQIWLKLVFLQVFYENLCTKISIAGQNLWIEIKLKFNNNKVKNSFWSKKCLYLYYIT